MKLTRRRITYACLATFAIFLFGGGLDFSIAWFYGGNVAMQNPTLSAFSPVAIMLITLGFIGILLVYHGATIAKTDVKLAKKQIEAGFIMVYFILIFLEVLYRVPLFL